MTLAETLAFHEAAVSAAAAAVDAARLVGDTVAEAAAIVVLEAADVQRQQFRCLWIKAHRQDLELEQMLDRDPLAASPRPC
jgi:hypothetical protein